MGLLVMKRACMIVGFHCWAGQPGNLVQSHRSSVYHLLSIPWFVSLHSYLVHFLSLSALA